MLLQTEVDYLLKRAYKDLHLFYTSNSLNGQIMLIIKLALFIVNKILLAEAD